MKNEITKQDLGKVKYGDLLDKFTELGIPEVWKAGTKKIKMIEAAIEKLKIKDSLESLGLDKVQVSDELKAIAKNKAQAEKDKAIEDAKQEIIKDKQEIKELKQQGFSKEQLEAQLLNVEKNLAQVLPTHRIALIKKKDQLMELLKKA